MARPSICEAAAQANAIERRSNEKPRHLAGLPFAVLQRVSGSGSAGRPDPGSSASAVAAGQAFGHRPAAAGRVSVADRADCPAAADPGSGWDFDFDSLYFLPTLVVRTPRPNI